jgi:threonylcarbamoyladenosine tRNA methylthiotransferase MtaB
VPLRRERAARLREAGRAAAARLLAGRVGLEEEVLFERPDRGHTAQFAPLRLVGDGARATPGEIRRLRVTAADGPDSLLAAAAGAA